MKTATLRAITAALDHLNFNRGRGDVGAWTIDNGGGTARRSSRYCHIPEFSFRLEFKESPARVTVRALGSTRTEKI